jgi:hypothetical protein
MKRKTMVFVLLLGLIMFTPRSCEAQEMPKEYQAVLIGPAETLASGFRAALDELGKTKKDGQNKESMQMDK